MNDWNKLQKKIPDSKNYNLSEKDWEKDIEIPAGFCGIFFDGDPYGYYIENGKGELCLAKLAPGDALESYDIRNGCTSIAANALKNAHSLKRLSIPASVLEIPEGSLSNGGGWTDTRKGLEIVDIHKDNEKFYADEYGIFERIKGGTKLLLYLEDNYKNGFVTHIPSDVISIGKEAFYSRKILKAVFEADGSFVSFPKHAYFNEELLKSFGENGRLYDFTAYDSFLLRKHFNADRIRMCCERISSAQMPEEETRKKLYKHIEDNLQDVLRAIAEENAASELKFMIRLGFFTQENIDFSIDVLNKTERRELMTYLMDYKHEKLKNTEFDFSI